MKLSDLKTVKTLNEKSLSSIIGGKSAIAGTFETDSQGEDHESTDHDSIRHDPMQNLHRESL